MKKLPIAAAAAALGSLMVLPASAQGANVKASTPVGSWEATVTRPGATENVQLFFSHAGKACLLTSGGESVGTWSPTGVNSFNFRIKEALADADGTQTGWVYINQYAAQVGSHFNSSGVSNIYDLNGNNVGSVVSKLAGTRGSAKPPAPCS
ncbi:hypothetical protein ACFVYF_26600 [Streptomyces sp. NPDC058274]|uniref:hypothetical protein n=1 Tax=Streptomyces sp. NPDC058274 TaxID=3346416 RepID=UPI0036EB937D